MAVIRVEKDKNYTCMGNYHLRDMRLSNKAIGLMCKMLSLPEDWDYSVRGLTKICKDGRDSILAQLRELEKCGYLRRERNRQANGQVAETIYTLSEVPCTENPKTEKPTQGKPTQGNPPQLNTKEINTKELNTEVVAATAENPPTTEEEELSEVMEVYKNNIHDLGGIEREMLFSLFDDFGKVWVLKAIEEAVFCNVRNIKYIGRILERWKELKVGEPWNVPKKNTKETSQTDNRPDIPYVSDLMAKDEEMYP